MKDREGRRLSGRALKIAGSAGLLVVASIAPVVVDGQESSITPTLTSTPDAYRTGVLVENGIVVCYSEEYPEFVFEDGIEDPTIIKVEDATQCVRSDGLEMEAFENVDAQLINWGGFEVIDLYLGVEEPPMFEGVDLGTVIYEQQP